VTVVSLGKAAFQGAPGAFSHEAVGLFAPGFDPVACDTFDQAFQAVRSGACTIAVLPIHNVTAGAVPEVSQGLPASGLRIVGQHDMVIRQNLMALRGVKLGDVREVRTHPMAIGQCLKFLREHDLKAVDALDTAGAARDLAASGERDVAVIAARAAAKLYGLNIVAQDIQDDPSNFTTFVVVAR
jgi:prephenate dehydratase